MYREQPAPVALHALLSCTWQQRVGSARTVQVLPDGCLDLLWNGAELRVAGPDTRPVREQCAPPHGIVGLRFRIGAASPILGVPASALRDTRTPLVDLWGDEARRLEAALHAARPANSESSGALERSGARALLAGAVEARAMRTAAPDPLVQRLVARLLAHAPAPSVAELARELGVTERLLHRRTVAQVGYGPKLLARILRLRAFRRALALAPARQLAELAAQHGYADQAHLTHEASELFGTTPGRMQRAALSDFDKTRAPLPGQAAAHGNT